MNDFLTWEQLAIFTVFTGVVFAIVEFIKEIKHIKNVPTKYLSALITFMLMLLIAFRTGTFLFWDIPLYLINGIFISLSANGLATFNSKKD